MTYRWRSDVLAQLPAHGVQPRETTPPGLVRDFVSELYKIELKKLRARLLRGEFEKAEYAKLVDAKRREYPVLALYARQWASPEEQG